MTDQDCCLLAHGVDDGDEIARQMLDVVVFDRTRTIRLAIAAHVGRYDVIAGGGQSRNLVTPGIPGFRKAVDEGKLDKERYLNFLNLENEIARLAKRQKKRQMNVERAGKRDRKVQARNYEDRVELERRHKPNHRSHD